MYVQTNSRAHIEATIKLYSAIIIIIMFSKRPSACRVLTTSTAQPSYVNESEQQFDIGHVPWDMVAP